MRADVLLFAAMAMPAIAGQPLAPSSSVPCDPGAVDRIARLLVELRHASPERQRSIGPEIAQALQAAIDRTPGSDPQAFERAATPCFVQALDAARRTLGGAEPRSAADPRPAIDPGAALAAAERAATLARLRQVKVALHAYIAEYDKAPTAEEGLKLLVDRGVLRRQDLLDGWGRVLIYRPAKGDPFDFEISSAGPDGVAHTVDDVSIPYLP